MRTHRKELRYDIVHFCKKGIGKRRRNNKHRKLSHEQVVQIKSDLKDGVSLTQTGRNFGVVTSTISEIAHGRTWKNII